MPMDEATSLPNSLGVTDEMMACPLPRLPFVDPDNIPAELKDELTPLYEWSTRMWGTRPAFFAASGECSSHHGSVDVPRPKAPHESIENGIRLYSPHGACHRQNGYIDRMQQLNWAQCGARSSSGSYPGADKSA